MALFCVWKIVPLIRVGQRRSLCRVLHSNPDRMFRFEDHLVDHGLGFPVRIVRSGTQSRQAQSASALEVS